MTTTAIGKKAPTRSRVLEPNVNAQKLFAWLQTEWDRMGIAPTAWCRQHEIPDPTVLRWRSGVEPDMRNLRRVANALGRSILDVLVAAEYMTQEEANGHVPQPIIVDAETAIRQDPRINDVLAEAMLSMWRNMEDIEAGIERRLETTVKSSRRGARSSTKRG